MRSTSYLDTNGTTPRTTRAAEVRAVADHLAKLDVHLVEIGKRAEAAVARRLAERLRATAARRLP